MVFSYILDFKAKKKNYSLFLNHPFVAVNRALFSFPNFFFLLHARSRVRYYCKVAHWDEGWAAGRGWGVAEKGLKCWVGFNYFFKIIKKKNKLQGGLSCGSIRSNCGFYWGLYSAVGGFAISPPAANVTVRTRCGRKSSTKHLRPPIPLPQNTFSSFIIPPKKLHFCILQLSGAPETLSCPAPSLDTWKNQGEEPN